MLPCRVDVKLRRRFLHEGAGGHHHDVRVGRQVADEYRKARVFHLVREAVARAGSGVGYILCVLVVADENAGERPSMTGDSAGAT